MVVCSRWHLQLILLHCPAAPLAIQTPKGTGSKGASSCQNTPRLQALSRKFYCLRKVHPPALLTHSFDSIMLHNFLWNLFKHQEHQLGSRLHQEPGLQRVYEEQSSAQATHVHKQNEVCTDVYVQTHMHPGRSAVDKAVTLGGTGWQEELRGIQGWPLKHAKAQARSELLWLSYWFVSQITPPTPSPW